MLSSSVSAPFAGGRSGNRAGTDDTRIFEPADGNPVRTTSEGPQISDPGPFSYRTASKRLSRPSSRDSSDLRLPPPRKTNMPQITHTTHHRDSGRWRPSTPDDIDDTRTHAIHFTARRNLSEPVGAHHIKQKEPHHGQPFSDPLGRGGPPGRDRPHRHSAPPTRTTPPRGPSRGWRAGTRICSPAPASPGQRGTRSARPSAFSRCCAKPEPRPRSRFRRRDAGGRPGCDRGGRRGRDFGLGRRAADRSGASRCRGRGAGCCRVRQGDEGGDEEVRK